MIRIMLADDSPEIRSYFASRLNSEEDILLTGEASSGSEAVRLARELQPDIVLMDIQMETRTAGITASRQILQELPGIRIIILTILEDDDLLFQAYCAGVIDYVIKTDSMDQILTSIRNASRNQLILRPQIAAKIIDELSRVREEEKNLRFSLNVLSRLSNSEFEVLKCIYSGMNARTISESRCVSIGTIKSQIHSILRKFDMKNMRDVIRKLDEVNFSSMLEK